MGDVLSCGWTIDLLSERMEDTKSTSGLEARPGAEVLQFNWERSNSSHVLIFDLSDVIML